MSYNMTQAKACVTDEFWELIESQMDCTVPLYMKNILRLRGFDNALTIKTLTVEDYKSLETFARGKMNKYIASDANLKDYYHMYSEEPEAFEFLPGHIRLLNEIVRHVTVMATPVMVLDPETRFDSAISTSNDKVGQLKNGYTTTPDDTLQNKAKSVVRPETFKALITVGSPDNFYIQLESSFTELNQLKILLEPASSWPILDEIVVGQICAALFDGSFYRAQILLLYANGAIVRFVDYGNKALSTNLRKLPESLQNRRFMAISCCLESKNGNFSPKLVEQFVNLSTEAAYEMSFVSEHSSPAIVQLFQNGVLFAEKADTAKSASKYTSEKSISDSDAESQNQLSSNPVETETSTDYRHPSSNFNFDNREKPSFPEGAIDPKAQIPFEPISVNSTHLVKLSWLVSPLEFFVTTVNSHLDYTIQMENIHHFYKNKSPMANKAAIGSFVIVKSKNKLLHRARIIYYNDKFKKYKAELIDVGAMIIVDASDIYEMDKIFSKLECQAIKCSLSEVALRASWIDTEGTLEKLMDSKLLVCKFIKKKADTFYVDIMVDGLNVKDYLIWNEYLSKLTEDYLRSTKHWYNLLNI